MKQKKLAVQISSRIVYDEKEKNYGGAATAIEIQAANI